MTKIRVFISKDNIYRGFSLQGHAGFSQSGEDIVCAALSALSTSCANSIERLAGQMPKADIDEESGTMSITFDFVPNEKTILFMESFELAVEQLLEGYSEYITFERIKI